MNPDKITTALGAVLAAGTAVQPVLNGAQGSLHQQDYLQLIMAAVIAIFGFLTNKPPKGAS